MIVIDPTPWHWQYCAACVLDLQRLVTVSRPEGKQLTRFVTCSLEETRSRLWSHFISCFRVMATHDSRPNVFRRNFHQICQILSLPMFRNCRLMVSVYPRTTVPDLQNGSQAARWQKAYSPLFTCGVPKYELQEWRKIEQLPERSRIAWDRGVVLVGLQGLYLSDEERPRVKHVERLGTF